MDGPSCSCCWLARVKKLTIYLPKHITEKVSKRIHTSLVFRLVQAFFATLVVFSSFVRIAESFVSSWNICEFVYCSWVVGVFIWVPLQRHRSVWFFDLSRRCRFGYTQYFVKVSVRSAFWLYELENQTCNDLHEKSYFHYLIKMIKKTFNKLSRDRSSL